MQVPIRYIDTQQGLEEFAAELCGTPLLTLDTEFLREKTYYPQLCLVQVAADGREALIDPLAPLDLRALVPVLTDPRTVKVFHAGDQDCAILYQALGAVVRPVFDTQRAALLLGLPQQASLVALVRRFCGVSLKKGESFSDWAQRPLTETQLSYAIDDVRYLPLAYTRIVSELQEKGRLPWLEDEFRDMEDEERYRVDAREVWQRLKGVAALRGSQLATVREVAAWREQAAQERNLPRKWVLPDDLLVEVARREPASPEDLYRVRGIKERLGKRWSQEVLAAVERAQGLSPDQWPTPRRVPARDARCVASLDLMGALLHQRAKELHIATSFLAGHDDLARLAEGQREGLTILKGWRRDLLGNELLRLLEGGISLSLDDGDLKVTLLSQAGVPAPS
ncbi:MAG: ribonuclease D [Coriobacteriales bacterium]|nr:ribonuclease D [Coriobacteriales bacterium]